MVDVDADLVVDWVVRLLPAAALRGVARSETADRIAGQPMVSERMLLRRNGLIRYRHRLRRAAIELESVVDVLEPPGRKVAAWEHDAHVYAEVGAACMDLAYRVEYFLADTGEEAGRWAVRVVHAAHRLDRYIRPGELTRLARGSYYSLIDTAVLDGRGRLESTMVRGENNA
ncbi:hypothetical protein [Nocardia neocaledoniensis]|uniref:hypothetical protein n=1 Tax=Nocardia neocaledoniensis TaxID=236511 RepID=UPI002455DC71|nr:hypothetical protein [Nocardia neocaledoniensis]